MDFFQFLFVCFTCTELVRCHWRKEPPDLFDRFFASGGVGLIGTLLLAGIEWLTNLRSLTIFIAVFFIYAALHQGHKEWVASRPDYVPLGRTRRWRNVAVFLVGLFSFNALVYLNQKNSLSDPQLFGVAVNLVALGWVLYKGYTASRPAFVLLLGVFLTFFAAMKRAELPQPMEFLMLWLFGAICFAAIGVFRNDRVSAVLFVLLTVLSTALFTPFRMAAEADTTPTVTISLMVLHGFAAVLTVAGLLIDVRSSEGIKVWAKQRLRDFVEPFTAFKVIEWFGVAVVVLSVSQLLVQSPLLDRALGGLYNIFNTIYSNTIEPIAGVIVEEAYRFLNVSIPSWLMSTLLTFGFLLRVAHLHSQRYADASLWQAIWSRLRVPREDEEIPSRATQAGLQTKEVTHAAFLLIAFLLMNVLSVVGWNPIPYLAPEGGMTWISGLTVAVAGAVIGVLLGSTWMMIERTTGRVQQVLEYFVVAVKFVFLGPALVLIAPFVAWRLLLASLFVLGLIVMFSGVFPASIGTG